ncbi:hypothetical protein FB451DRAFT_1185901 [Mycena latifolia]|nr:hypothetical protein FB451DRAFT_1185901 [Mycena latifolia]
MRKAFALQCAFLAPIRNSTAPAAVLRDTPVESASVVKNEFGVGHAKLLSGQPETFLTRTAGGRSATGNENEPVSSPEQEYPANPVTVCEGIMDVGTFITGK